jgi:hypothetical protein
MENKFKRFYTIAGITIRVESDLPIDKNIFSPAIQKFEVETASEDVVVLRHHFQLPKIEKPDRGKLLFLRDPWAIYERQDSWLYLGSISQTDPDTYNSVAIFNSDYSLGDIYHKSNDLFSLEGKNSLTSFPTDQIYLSQLLALRNGLFIHSAGAIINGSGALFIGHSEAGKSTITQMLLDSIQSSNKINILCDDRNIVRLNNQNWFVSGSWSHGDISKVSPATAPLSALFFIEQSNENHIDPILEKEVFTLLLGHVIKSLETSHWWDNTLSCVKGIASSIPAYRLRFNKNGIVINKILEMNNFHSNAILK